jgi:predicted nucleic acid-binding protein
MIVVADTSPILYLLLLNQLELLPQLYQHILIPSIVRDEMFARGAPIALQQWIEQPPSWLKIRVPQQIAAAELKRLDPGERAAIQLAQELSADLLIIDDKAGRQVALSMGLRITGLLGVLSDATTLNLIDLPTTLDRLFLEANFRASPTLIQSLLSKHDLTL